MFREGMLFNRGFFLNLKEFRITPIKVSAVAKEITLTPRPAHHKVA